ncbi:hypothetical protein M9H77_35165 [Catharanthus roseus]|uniref:Uncharacterized protein n=1 Tax=Catharanthus roseus TaxID=4058 RepID=A0ACB9ZNH9_CATRO|nr:hypothetical protein M9H77_35165 [Catharanthus roseus]
MLVLSFKGTFAQMSQKTGNFCPSRRNFCKIFAQTGESFFGNEDPNTIEEFLEPEKYINHGHLFTIDRIFNSKDELVEWAKQTAMKTNTYLIINRYQKSRISDSQRLRKNMKPIDDDEEEEVPIKRRGLYGTKNVSVLLN